MLPLCNCGEDLALTEMFAETVVEEETMVVSSQDVPVKQKKNISDYFGKSSRASKVQDRVVYYETRTVYKEIQDDSWMYDDLRLFSSSHPCKNGALMDIIIEEDETDKNAQETKCEQRVDDNNRTESSTGTIRDMPASSCSSISKSTESSGSSSKRSGKKLVSRNDRNEAPILQTFAKPEESSNKKKKKKRNFLRATDRNETPYIQPEGEFFHLY